jgi:hypothetical protein
VRRRQAAPPLKGLEGVGLLREGGRQTRHDLRLPRIPDQGECVSLDKTVSLMTLDSQGALLKMVVIVSHPIFQEDRAGYGC